jgi:hypothetical protein
MAVATIAGLQASAIVAGEGEGSHREKMMQAILTEDELRSSPDRLGRDFSRWI